MKASADAAGRALPFTPMSSDDIDNRAAQISQQAIAAHSAMEALPQTVSSWLGKTAGALASQAVDPYNIPLMAIDAEGLGILGTAAAFGIGSAATQAVNEAANSNFNEKVQPGYAASGQAIGNIAEAGVSGLVMGGGIKALGNVLTRAVTGAWPTAAKDAANGVMSEADILKSNEMPVAPAAPAAPGEPAIPPDVAAVSQGVMARVARDRGFTLPTGFDAAETSRLSEEAELHERSGALTDQIAGLPAGDQGAAETLARLRQVESELSEATTPEARRALSDRRDELLTDTNPDTLQAAAAPIEQRRAMTSEQASIDDRLQEIDNERGQAQLDRTLAGQASQEPTRIIPQNILPGAEGEAAHNAALGKAIGDVLKGDPVDVSSAIPPGSDFERRIGDLPPAHVSEGEPAEPALSRPGSLTGDQIREQLAAPETDNAARADLERAIDQAAQKGEVLQMPTGVHWAMNRDGSLESLRHSLVDQLLGADNYHHAPIFGSVADQLAEVDRMNELANQIAQCAMPGAMQMAAE
jgi:hypothetical protein